MGRQVPIRAGVGASGPAKGELPRQRFLSAEQAGGLSARPLHPFGSPLEAIERPIGLQAPSPAPESARQAPGRKLLPAELSCNAACRGLSARPLHPFGSSSENNAYGTASPSPAPESARQAPPKNIPAPEYPHKKAEDAHYAPLPLSHLFQGIKLPAPVDLPREPLRHRPGDKVRRAADRLVLAERVRHGVDK